MPNSLEDRVRQASNYGSAILRGTEDAAIGIIHSAIHPYDTLIRPVHEFLQDAQILSAAYSNGCLDFNNGFEYGLIQHQIASNPQIRFDAERRMDGRITDAVGVYNSFANGSGPERVQMATSLLVGSVAPGYMINGVRAFSNLHHFGTPNPPRFHTDVLSESPYLRPKSFERLQRSDLKSNIEYMYVVNRYKELIITEQKYDHWHLGQNGFVYAAGDVIMGKSGIIRVDNRSGSYLPQWKGLQNLIEFKFNKEGFPDALGKYVDHFEETKFYRESSDLDWTPIITSGRLGIPSPLTTITVGGLYSALNNNQLQNLSTIQQEIIPFNSNSVNTELSNLNARALCEPVATSSTLQGAMNSIVDSFGLVQSPEFATPRPASSRGAVGFFRESHSVLNESVQSHPFTLSQRYSVTSSPDIGSSLREVSLRGRTRGTSSTALIAQRLMGADAASSQVSLPNTTYRSRESIIHDNNYALGELVGLRERTEQHLPQREHSEFRLPVRDYPSYFINESQKNSFVLGEFSIFLSERPPLPSLSNGEISSTQGNDRSSYLSGGTGHENCVTTDGGCVTTDGGHVTTGYGG